MRSFLSLGPAAALGCTWGWRLGPTEACCGDTGTVGSEAVGGSPKGGKANGEAELMADGGCDGGLTRGCCCSGCGRTAAALGGGRATGPGVAIFLFFSELSSSEISE